VSRKHQSVIYRSQTIQDGMVVSEKTIKRDRFHERFIMFVVTDGLWWLQGFTSLTDMKVFACLSERMNERNRVSLSPVVKTDICGELNITKGSFYNSLVKLTKREMVKKFSYADFMVNPKIVFKTNADKINELRKEYETTNA
jgi:hypothetical protein